MVVLQDMEMELRGMPLIHEQDVEELEEKIIAPGGEIIAIENKENVWNSLKQFYARLNRSSTEVSKKIA